MRIVVSGATGFIGSALVDALAGQGHEVVALSRSGRPGTVMWDPAQRSTSVEGDVDAIVHLAGESIGGRWTARKKKALLKSRIDGTVTMAKLAIEQNVGVFVSGSAIGYYGSRGDTPLVESSEPGDGFLAEMTVEWEEAARPAITAGIPTSFARTALVLAEDGGSFPRMLLPFKFGIGGPIGSGDQWWSWISLRDEVRAIVHILENAITGPVNLAAPEPVRNRDFATELGHAVHRPSFLPAPAFGLKVLLGAEVAEEVVLASQRVIPQVLIDSGFEYLDGDLAATLRRITS